MNRVAQNILANFAGQGWSVIVSIAFIPLYIKFLGVEAYGLIGFYVVLQGILQTLDLGLSPTMNREMARYSTMPEKASEARNFVRTLEVGYWLLGALIGLIIVAIAPLIANFWVKASTIPTADVQHSVRIMGILVTLQWPLSFYGSGLMGLQKQVLLNSVVIAITTVSSVGTVLILWLISPTVIAFFIWQVIISAFQVVTITIIFWRSLPASRLPARFDISLIRDRWRFAAGMSGIVLTGIILSNLDKVVLSKLLSLEMFGYYTLAGAVGRGLYVVITPIFNAFFPRLSVLVADGNIGELKELYHRASQLMVVLVISLAAVVALFSYDILALWLGSTETARKVAPIASLLVIGTALNGLMNIPFALQLAYGWTRIGLYINSCFILALVPTIIFMTTYYGAIGGASVWLLLNGCYLLIGIPLTHKFLLPGEARRCFLEDIGLPGMAALAVVVISRMLIVGPLSSAGLLIVLGLVLLCALTAATLTATHMRVWFVNRLPKLGIDAQI